MSDFWLSSGHLLLDRDDRGLLVPTDEFLKLYLARPEVVPPPEACAAERALYDRMFEAPRSPVTPADIAALADADARDNWQLLIAFRDHLVAHSSLEAAYLALMRQGVGQTPPLFINQIVHVLMRNVLDGETDPFTLRAAEPFWRPQRLTRHDGRILLADEELVDGTQADMHTSPLVAMLGDQKAKTLDVLGDANAGDYLARSDAFDLVLDFRPSGDGRSALARVMERWLGHMLGLDASIAPLETIEDKSWFWYIGLDAEATRIGNALWQGRPVDDGAEQRIVALYSLRLDAVPAVAGRPIYLMLAMTPQNIVRMKPQNLLLGLPPGVTGGANG